MAPTIAESLPHTSIQLADSNDNATFQSTFSVKNEPSNIALNLSNLNECVEIRFSEMEYLPWDNPDNIISAEVEKIIYRVKDNLLGFMFLIGGPANVINMVVFYKQGLKDRVYMCLFVLSLTDGLYLITLILMHGEQLYLQFISSERYGPLTSFMININLPSLGVFGYVSTFLSAIIAIERCYCVLNPLKFQTVMSTKIMGIIITAIYVVVFALLFIVVFRYRVGCVHDVESGVVFNSLVVGQFYNEHKQFIELLDGIVYAIALPWIVIITVITSTLITIIKLRQIVTWRAGTTSSLSAGEVALTKMLIGNSILFIACVAPRAMFRLCWLFFPEMNSGGRNQNFFLTGLWVGEMFSNINASFNIFVYYAMGSRYRETFWALFGRKK